MPLDTDPIDVDDEEGAGDRAIVHEAHRRFERCQKWESTARANWREDLKFCEGDSLNNWQWPSEFYAARNGAARPTLTINHVRQLCLHIINDALQNKAGIKFRPVGDGATKEAADIWEGIVRHIQNVSKAQSLAHGMAIKYQVKAGLGFTRVVTDYAGEDTFDQECYIRGVEDVASCYIDPDATEQDGSDARFAFVFADLPRDLVEDRYPELKGRLSVSNSVDGDDAGWLRDDHIRECEYYKVVEEDDELIGNDEGLVILKSEIEPSDLLEKWEAEAEAAGKKLQRRPVIKKRVVWYKIVGDQIVDETDCPNKTIPIIPWIGEKSVIDDRIDYKGHTRALRSPQEMMNYNFSAAVEFGALQSKTPYITPVAAIEDLETYWESANTVNHAVLPYKHRDDDGNEIPKPERQEPPSSAPAYLEGAEAAERNMQLASGQYQAQLGAESNEKSGKAINERQRMGDRATYHYIENQSIAIRREGEIIMEIVPKIYDRARVIRILGEDGTESHVKLDPMHPTAHGIDDDEITKIFNPNIGKYEIVPDVGPDYATQRQEAFNAIVQILTQAPELINKIGDLLFKVADFPLADEIAERLKPGLPPEAQKQIEELQQELMKQKKLTSETFQSLTEERLKVKAKDTDADVDAFRADTERLKVVMDAAKDDPMMLHEMLKEMAGEAIRQAMQDNLGPVRGAAAPNLARDATMQPLPGASDMPPPAQGLVHAPAPQQIPPQMGA